MRARQVGSIVGISSELALLGDAGRVPYVTAKTAMLGLIRSAAHEYGPDQVRLNVVAPGPTDTELLTDRWRAADLYGADADTAYLQNGLTNEPVIIDDASGVVLGQGHQPDSALADLVAEHSANASGPEVHLVGDCLLPREVEEAVLEGLRVGCAI